METTEYRREKIQMAIEPEWHVSEDDCPKCGKATQEKHVAENGHVFITAERCVPCGWVIEF